MYLKRYHDVTISPSRVWRILQRLGLNRLPASQRHKRLDRRYQRYEKQLPGHALVRTKAGVTYLVHSQFPASGS
jgi:hypothetical protein